jgi:multidrug resistance efflux pump
MTKYLIAGGLITVMATTIAVIDLRSDESTATRQRTSESSSASGGIYATGIVEGASQDVELLPEQAGRIAEVLVAAGDEVKRGQVLLRLDSARQEREVALAEADRALALAELERLKNGARREEREEANALVRAAHARLIQAEQTWKRIQPLRHGDAITLQDVDNQQAAVDTSRAELEAARARLMQIEAPAREDEMRAAEARVAAAQAKLDLANINLTKTALCAPHRGRVLDVNVEAGEMTGPDAPHPLVVLADTTTIRVRAFVEELDAPRVRVGMEAEVKADGLPNTVFPGRVVSISPRMVAKSFFAERPGELYDTKVREVLLELAPNEQLILGLRVDVSFRESGDDPATNHTAAHQ